MSFPTSIFYDFFAPNTLRNLPLRVDVAKNLFMSFFLQNYSPSAKCPALYKDSWSRLLISLLFLTCNFWLRREHTSQKRQIKTILRQDCNSAFLKWIFSPFVNVYFCANHILMPPFSLVIPRPLVDCWPHFFTIHGIIHRVIVNLRTLKPDNEWLFFSWSPFTSQSERGEREPERQMNPPPLLVIEFDQWKSFLHTVTARGSAKPCYCCLLVRFTSN